MAPRTTPASVITYPYAMTPSPGCVGVSLHPNVSCSRLTRKYQPPTPPMKRSTAAMIRRYRIPSSSFTRDVPSLRGRRYERNERARPRIIRLRAGDHSEGRFARRDAEVVAAGVEHHTHRAAIQVDRVDRVA